MRRIAIIPLYLALGGCYAYSAVGMNAVPQGARVSADLTTRGAADYEGQLGDGVMVVEGTLASLGPDSLALDVVRTRNRSGSWVTWSGERVTIPQDAVATLRERKFSIARTAIATAAFAAAIVVGLATDLVGSGDGGGDPTNPKPNPNPGEQ